MVKRNPKWLVVACDAGTIWELTLWNHMPPASPDGQVKEPNPQAEDFGSQLFYFGACQWAVLSSIFHKEGGETPEPLCPSWPQPWTFLAFTSPSSHFSCDIKEESLLTRGHHCSFAKPSCRMYRTSGIKEVLSFNHSSVFCRDKWVGPSCPNRLS